MDDAIDPVIDEAVSAGTVLAGGPVEGRRTVVFFRDFVGFTGGHLKVWNYFEHVRSSPGYVPLIVFSPRTHWDSSNPWMPLLREGAQMPRLPRADILFVAGLDWFNVAPKARARSRTPIINLLQGVRHSDPAGPLRAFLSHHAIRICVSSAVAGAVTSTGLVNGPLHVISNGTDIATAASPASWSARSWDVAIAALKAPKLGAALGSRLSACGRRVRLLDAWVPRQDFLSVLADSRVAVLLPSPQEGFYLPALEAMALGALVVSPDCLGNRDVCVPGKNCLQPAYTENDLVAATLEMLELSSMRREAMLTEARRMAALHDLSTERKAFLAILESAEASW